MKKILLSLLLAGGVQNSFAMQSAGGVQAAESGFRVEGQVSVKFSDGSVANLDLQRLQALNSGLLQGMLFTADGLSGLGELSEDKPFHMEVFVDLADFVKFETALKLPLQGEIADMVVFFKKADFLEINTDGHLKGLLARDKAQFFKLCRALLAENEGFVLNMQRVCPEILHHAISSENRDFAKMLIAAGADVKVIDKGSRTALMYAAQYGPTEIAQLLIAAAGADVCAYVNAKYNQGRTALMEAAMYGETETVKLLIDKGADVNSRDNQGWTALMMAANNGYEEIAHLFIAAGADVNSRNNDGETALMIALSIGQTETAQLLIAANADVNARDNDGSTALMEAARYGQIEKARLLIAKGADVNSRNNDGETVLMKAAAHGHVGFVGLLIAEGVDVHASNRYGLTALVWALGYAEIKKLLRDAGAS